MNIALFYEAVLGNEVTNSRIRQLKKIGPPQNRPTAIRPFFLDSTRFKSHASVENSVHVGEKKTFLGRKKKAVYVAIHANV